MDNALPSVARCSALISAFAVALMLGGCVGNTETARSATCLDRLPATPAAIDAEAADWIDTLEFDGGLHVQGGRLYAFDRYDSRVTAVDMQQRVVWQSGRRGDGPMEFSPHAVGERLWPMNARWLHATGDTIAVFDGRRVLLLEHGTPRRQLVVPATWLSGLVRVHALHWLDERTLVLVIETGPEVFGRVEDSQRLELVRLPLDGSKPTLLLSLPTLPWPRNLAGMPVRGLGEAGPTVAVHVVSSSATATRTRFTSSTLCAARTWRCASLCRNVSRMRRPPTTSAGSDSVSTIPPLCDIRPEFAHSPLLPTVSC
jgi:hypothetical protein